MTSADRGDQTAGVEQATVAADYFQYHVHDDRDIPDWSRLEFTTDGVIAPLGTGVVIQTGALMGLIQVELRFPATAPPLPAADVVAAECDLDLPSGTVVVAGWSGPPHRHLFGHPTRARLRAEMQGRDVTSPDGSGERHTLTIWETDAAAPRWRSAATDAAAEHLAPRRP
jgi:hypothetical protein